MKYRILTYPQDAALLRRKAKRVKNFQSTEVLLTIQAMKHLALKWEKENPGQRCEGLAATQIGVPLRIVIMRKTNEDVPDPFRVLINPVYVSSEGMDESEEACMSVPGKVGKTLRPHRSEFHYYDEKGKRCPAMGKPDDPNEYVAEGFSSWALCHELDHLNGILYIDSAFELRDRTPADTIAA